jgi:hypothetical protein
LKNKLTKHDAHHFSLKMFGSGKKAKFDWKRI